MPKIQYKEINFRGKSLELINLVNQVINEYKNQGYELTLRQTYYQLVARGYIPNNERSYKNIGNLINDGRLAGLIDWYSIVDRTRNLRGMGMMNLQTAIAQGVVSLPWTTGSDTTSSYAAATGSTASLGNGTGRAEKTTTYEGGVAKEYTVDGKTSVCWRGKENFWGNIWKFVYGINIWGNGKMGGGQPYICSDFSFAESKNSGNYEPAGFTVTNANGYISAMGYSTACDWLFIASECLGNSSLPVGDYTYITVNLNGYRIALLGGFWAFGGYAGGFCWVLNYGIGNRSRNIGGRLVYIPTRDSATYTAAIEAWKQKMAA